MAFFLDLSKRPQSLLLILFVFIAGMLVAAEKSAPAAAITPTELSGMYTFLQEGEFVQITVQPEAPAPKPGTVKVDGFVSRFGEDDSDQGTVLNQFFTSGELKEQSIHFVTRKVHGVWYEFTGQVERGKAQSRAEEGYYLIRGTLVENRELAKDKSEARSRELVMKLMPEMDDQPATPSAKSDKQK
jgi:hypothetical protein